MINQYSDNFPEPNDPSADPLAKRDPALAFFLAQISDAARQGRSVSIGMTLVVSGQVIRGRLITGRHWAGLMEDLLENPAGGDHTDDELMGELAHAFEAWDLEGDELAENRVTAAIADPASRFIHMKEVTIGSAPNIEGARAPIWRGLVESIDGWSISEA